MPQGPGAGNPMASRTRPRADGRTSQHLKSSKNHGFHPTATLTAFHPDDSQPSFVFPGAPSLNMGVGMSQMNVGGINSAMPSKKREKPKGELINPNVKKRKLNTGAKFV